MNATTLDDAAAAAARCFLRFLEATEDFDAFEEEVDAASRGLAARAAAGCLEAYDDRLFEERPRSWRSLGRPARTVVSVFGAVTYRRRLYEDEFGRRRYLLDELLGIPRRARFTPGALLWMVRRAARVSYRQAAADFGAMSRERVSAMCVWRAVQRQAELIASGDGPARNVSQADVYAECDGLFVALQSPERRARALPRFLYEQSRERRSVELKCGCVYAGRREASPGRRVRGNVALVATAGGAEEFWGAMEGAIRADYDVSGIETLHLASDGGPWCVNHRLGGIGAEIDQGLDLFHVMQRVVRAFPEGDGRQHLFSLALRRRPERLAEACARMLPAISGPRREKVRDLASYVSSNADLLRGTSLGTMEATNAYAWAKRMKSFGCSWSRAGADAMAKVISRTACGRPLAPFPKDAFYTEEELGRRERAIAERGQEAARQMSAGSGWEYPNGVQTWTLPREQRFRARTC